jgi:hypothetical protein
MRHLMILLLFTLSLTYGQSLWIETGVGYLEQFNSEGVGSQNYTPSFKIGARVVFPVSERAGVYLAPSLQGGFTVDAGGWFTLPLTIEDIEGFTSYLGTGLTLANGRFGVALSGALSYDLNDNIALAFIYTHRPLLSPSLSQGFDVSVGLQFDLGN